MALTHYYVDPGGGSDSTGDGSIGTPWASIQHALDTITRNSTDGDQINLKAGTADVLAAPLSLATYGTPTYLAPLVIRGYSNEPNDRGMGAIHPSGAFSCIDNSFTYVLLADLEFSCLPNSYALSSTGTQMHVYRCQVTGGGRGISLSGMGVSVVGCYVEVSSGAGISIGHGSVIGCYVKEPILNSWDAFEPWNAKGIRTTGTGTNVVMGNVVLLNNNVTNQQDGIAITRGHGSVVSQNAVINLAAGRGKGISMANVYQADLRMTQVFNNIVAGFSGTGGVGIGVTGSNLTIALMVAHNALYNIATPYSYNHIAPLLAFDNITLDADPFVDAANGDFRLTDAAQAVLRSAGWPASYLGAHANSDPHVTIGAMQYGPTVAVATANLLRGKLG